jgi:hypothetical protein
VHTAIEESEPMEAAASGEFPRLKELIRYPFAAYAIAAAPDEPGIYILWERGELTYIGSTAGDATIHSILLDHLANPGKCPCRPTHYSWRLARQPKFAEYLLLKDHLERFQTLPRCNRR